MKTITRGHIKCLYPKDWALQKRRDRAPETDYFIGWPAERAQEQPAPGVKISSWPSCAMMPPMDAEQYQQQNIAMFKIRYADYEIISLTKGEVGPFKYPGHLLRVKYARDEGTFMCEELTFQPVSDWWGHLKFFATPPEAFNRYWPLWDRLIKSVEYMP